MQVAMSPVLAPTAPRARRFRTPTLIALLALVALAVLLRAPVQAHVDAARLLTTFSQKEAPAPLQDEQLVSIPTERGPVRGRLYVPPGVTNPPAIVIVHGVHYKGIEEPRLQKFSRAVASQGIAVLTPEIAELADYHVDPRSIETVGASLRFMSERTGKAKVGLMGMSFGGGLSLIAAADPRWADMVSVVVAVGAHDDVPRVSRFFAHQKTTFADGHPTTIKPHDYGATVLVYDRVGDFFPKDEEEIARSALRHWLREEQAQARADAARLSPASRKKAEDLFDGHFDQIDPELLAEIGKNETAMSQVSPRGHLAGLRAKAFILHGEGDTVIPASEASYLAEDVPHDKLASVLVSPAIVHVEIDKEPSKAEQWALLRFMGEVLLAARGG
jgi:acetyl esterase/lipase